MTTVVKRTHDGAFYQDLVVFEVAGAIFRVPKEGFDLPGAMFRDMFSFPPGEDQTAEGPTDDQPIVIPGVTQREFRNLLSLMHPNVSDGGPPTKKEDLLDALKHKLSSMWMLDRVKESAVELLEPFLAKPSRRFGVSLMASYKTLLEKVKLGQDYSVEKWIHECCVDLAHSKHPVDYEAFLAAGVGPQIIAKIATTREKVFLYYTRELTEMKEHFLTKTKKDGCTNCQEVAWGLVFHCTEMCWRPKEHDPQIEYAGPPIPEEFNCYGCNRPLRMLDVAEELESNLSDVFVHNDSVLGRD